MALDRLQFKVPQDLAAQIQEILDNGDYNTRTDCYLMLMRTGVERYNAGEGTTEASPPREQAEGLGLSFYT